MKINKKKWLKRFLWTGVVLFILLFTFIYFCNQVVINSSDGRIYSSTGDIPQRKVGLVLGTSKESSFGGMNLYFKYRMEAAAALFLTGKVKHLIVSGDNSVKEYDECTDMKNALIALGVPDSCITLDYAGFRTLDSVVRCKEVFGQDSITIISQEFHNQRAVYLAENFGIDAIGYNAKEVNSKYSMKTNIREYFAKVKAVLDVKVFGTDPKFLGKKEPIAF